MAPPQKSPGRPQTQSGDCLAEGCDRPQWSRHLCHSHYARWRRGVEVDTPIGTLRPVGGRKIGLNLMVTPEQRDWLVQRRADTGSPMNVIIREALTAYMEED